MKFWKTFKLKLQMVFNPKKVEWWIHIGPENFTPTPDDIQVGDHKLDRALLIYGEPRTWWDKKIKEPQARYVMTELWRHEASCALTSSAIENCPEALYPRVRQWQYTLRGTPPTRRDWEDSGFDFSVSAKDKIGTASQSGSPIAVPVLIHKKKNEEREAKGFDPFHLPPITKSEP